MAKEFVDRCDCCGAYKPCKGINGHLLCTECAIKTGGRLELQHPIQAALFGLDEDVVEADRKKRGKR